MRKKIALITAAAICMIMLLTACSNQIDKSTIMKDIEPKLSGILSNDEKIDDIEILEYNTDNEKDTSISLKVKSSDEVAEYINYFIATYYYSSDGQWVHNEEYTSKYKMLNTASSRYSSVAQAAQVLLELYYGD